MALLKPDAEPRESPHEVEMRFLIASDETPDQKQIEFQRKIRGTIYTVARVINDNVEDGREKSLALTHLEEALMWAGKAIFK